MGKLVRRFIYGASLLICSITLVGITNVAFAAAPPSVNVFQITNDSSQQSGPLVYGNLVAYNNWGSTNGIGIWGYNLKTKTNYQIISNPGQQFLTGLYKKLIVYQDYNATAQTYSVHLYNMSTDNDTLVTPGTGTFGSGGTNGSDVTYIAGGVCGQLMDYKIKTKVTTQISSSACNPEISGNNVVWAVGVPGGTNIYGYNLSTDTQYNVSTGQSSVDSPNIYGDNVVWQETNGTNNMIMMENLITGSIKTLYSTTDYINYPAISRKYVVWCESTGTGTAGINGIDLKTGQVFEIFPESPQQNTNMPPAIWKNTAVWSAFGTGNGDIYGAKITT